KVIGTVYNSLKDRGKRLIVRDFLRTPTELELFVRAMQTLPQEIGVYSKNVPNDFRYNYPPNPNLGRFPDRLHVMEIEPSIPGGAGYYQSQIQLARDHGLDGVIPRIRPADMFREFNQRAYNQLIHDPDRDLAPLWTD